jgi:hypothetical protein
VKNLYSHPGWARASRNLCLQPASRCDAGALLLPGTDPGSRFIFRRSGGAGDKERSAPELPLPGGDRRGGRDAREGRASRGGADPDPPEGARQSARGGGDGVGKGAAGAGAGGMKGGDEAKLSAREKRTSAQVGPCPGAQCTDPIIQRSGINDMVPDTMIAQHMETRHLSRAGVPLLIMHRHAPISACGPRNTQPQVGCGTNSSTLE